MKKTRFNVMNILQKVDNNKVYHYIVINDVGRSIKIYIADDVMLYENVVGDTIDFPIVGAKFSRTQKGTILIVPDSNYMAFIISANSGFRGSVNLYIDKIKVYKDDDVTNDYQVVSNLLSYHSPKGALGATDNILINIPKTVKRITIPAYRTGRRIDNNDIIVTYDFNLDSDYPVTKSF